ncbi:hypothetical protein [Streptomyces sp. ISL-10]|uniref:hypothetical protein n=1 Tax=Streptomyces sp. ISL-10 TaxID=2819172 RepID=UPI002035D422|nr:hypothetical protein [Streptomyces sp. ISL-10]
MAGIIDFDRRQFTPVKQVQRDDSGLVLKDLKTESSQSVLPLPTLCAGAPRVTAAPVSPGAEDRR